MFFKGIDIGSRTGKSAVVDESGKLLYKSIIETKGSAFATFEKLQSFFPEKFADTDIPVAATGYGRVAVEKSVDDTFTEITCHYRGALKIFGELKTIIDIGGQDSKVITVADGRIKDFAMNDRCAAGTGMFIEVMLGRLGITIDEFAAMDVSSIVPRELNSTCTVFAESEVVSLMAEETNPLVIASSVALMAAKNIGFMVKRIHGKPPYVMTGGVSAIKPVIYHLENILKADIMTSPLGQMAGAFGAALLAADSFFKRSTNETLVTARTFDRSGDCSCCKKHNDSD